MVDAVCRDAEKQRVREKQCRRNELIMKNGWQSQIIMRGVATRGGTIECVWVKK